MSASEPIAAVAQKVPAEFVFSIMPFGGYFNQYYEEIYCPAIKEAGLDYKRADDLYRPSTIVHDIWRYTKECRLVLADLTGKNPNVLYELGLAHAIAKPGIIITENLEDIPFDLRALRIIEYDKNAHNWGELLKSKITKSIKEVLNAPLKAVLPAFIESEPHNPKQRVSAADKELIEMSQEIELLRREVRHMQSSRTRAIKEEPIDPDTAEALIEDSLRRNPEITMRVVISEIAPLGVPTDWIVRTYKNVKERIDSEIPF